MTEWQMQVVISPDKCKANGYNYSKLYCLIDNYCMNSGLIKKDHGVWYGTNDAFYPIMKLGVDLPDTDWFLKVVDEWYVWEKIVDDNHRIDALKTYYDIWGFRHRD